MHEYILGKTGVGKTTFLQNHILGNEGGFALLDPHGDLAEAIADTIDCIYWDTSDAKHVIGLNVLQNVPPDRRHLAAAQSLASLKAIWGESWGPRLEWILYNSLRLLIDANGSLLDIPRLLTDAKFRASCLKRASYPDFWEREFDEWDDRYRNEAIGPVLNKVGQLVANPILRNILARSTLDISRVMDRGQRLVVNLSKGKLGEEPSHLLGALLVSTFAQAAEARAAIPFEQRVPFTLYADEFQNFTTDSFAHILSEARKYRLSLVLAHQFLGQLSDHMRQAVLGNVGRIVSFRISAEDAERLAPEFGLHVPIAVNDYPTMPFCEFGLHYPSALSELPSFTAWERTDGKPYQIKTGPPPPRRGRLQSVINRTRARYSRLTRP